MAAEYKDRTKGWELTPWSQLMVLMYGQLEGCRSLRELTDLTTAHGSKYFHLGFGRLPETFFIWLKQHLQVKKLWGNSENAVRIQIYTAIITYCTVAIIEKTLNLNRSVYEVLRILSGSLLAKDSITELFTPTREPMPVMSGQLQLEL